MNDDPGKTIESLLDYDEKAMCKEIALRAAAVRADAAVSGQLNPQVFEDPKHLGITDDLVELGGRIFRRIERELHGMLCSADGKKDRESIVKSLGGDAALGAALYALLTASLGLAPAVATVVAALLIKRIFKPAGEEFCDFWAKELKKRS